MHERLEAAVRLWNEAAEKHGVPRCRVPYRRVPGLKALLRDEPDLDIVRRAMLLAAQTYASMSFDQRTGARPRYGLSNFLRRRHGYIDAAWAQRDEEKAKEKQKQDFRPLTIEEMADRVGLTVSQYKELHGISEGS